MDQQNEALRAIDQLADLPEGWDSYGAPKVAQASREIAKHCMREIERLLGSHYAKPIVGPTPEGGVALIWRKERGSEIDVLCTPLGARYVLLSPHRQVVGEDHPIADFGYFAMQVLKRLDL